MSKQSPQNSNPELDRILLEIADNATSMDKGQIAD